jgi:predicted phage terminase large subunit-like protein
MAKANNVYYIVDYITGQWEAGEREAIIKQTAVTDRENYGHVIIGHEQEPGSGGKESAQNTTRVTLAGFATFADKVTGDKVTRAEPLASQATANNVKLIQASWNRSLIDMFCRFPAKPRDGVDASSGAFNKLVNYGGNLILW